MVRLMNETGATSIHAARLAREFHVPHLSAPNACHALGDSPAHQPKYYHRQDRT
jgi:hypothetical protein